MSFFGGGIGGIKPKTGQSPKNHSPGKNFKKPNHSFSKKQNPIKKPGKVFLIQNLDTLFRCSDSDEQKEYSQTLCKKLFEYFDQSEHPFIIECQKELKDDIGDDYMTWFDEIELKTKSISGIMVLLTIIINLENLISQTNIRRFSYNSKVAKKLSEEDILREQIFRFKESLLTIKENIPEYLKKQIPLGSLYKLVLGSKINLSTILIKSQAYFTNFSKKQLDLLASDSLMQVNKVTELQKQFPFDGFQIKKVNPEYILEFHELELERQRNTLNGYVQLAETSQYLEFEQEHELKVKYLNMVDGFKNKIQGLKSTQQNVQIVVEKEASVDSGAMEEERNVQNMNDASWASGRVQEENVSGAEGVLKDQIIDLNQVEKRIKREFQIEDTLDWLKQKSLWWPEPEYLEYLFLLDKAEYQRLERQANYKTRLNRLRKQRTK